MSVATQYTTTPGPDQSTATPRLVPAQDVRRTGPAIPVSLLFLGAVSALVSAWGAIAPFAGPDFGYVADRSGAWQWSATSAYLGLGPGLVGFFASLAVVAMATHTSYARRADIWGLGLVVALCGAWFAVGQYVWPVVYGTHYIMSSTVSHFMWKELAFAIGPGVILVYCGGVFMGWAVRRQLAVVADRSPSPPTPLDAARPVADAVEPSDPGTIGPQDDTVQQTPTPS